MPLPSFLTRPLGRGQYATVAQREPGRAGSASSGSTGDGRHIQMTDREAIERARRKSSDATMVNDDDEEDEAKMAEFSPLNQDACSTYSFYGDEPSDEDRRTLRKIPDKLPWSAFLVAVVELCERFTFYGLSGPFQNYISNEYHDITGLPGAIGLGQVGATGLTNFFQFWCFITPIIGAVVADQYLGKYRTIVYFSIIYIVGIFILFATSLPIAIEHGAALPGLITAMIVIGLGTGGIKSNVSPLIAEQYRGNKQMIKVLDTGERVIIDPAVTIQRIYMIFYMCINIGSLSSLVTTTLEQRVGFWAAYFIPFVMFIIGFCILVSGKDKYVVRPPKGSIVIHCFRALWIAACNKGNLDAAKPSQRAERGQRRKMPWSDLFIDELKRAMVACKVFCFFPIYWLCLNQMTNNFVSQAGQMELHGIPNDIMQNIDPITIILFIPILDRVVYPLLRRNGITFKPITRIFVGFITGACGMAWAAYVQHRIYTSPPCYSNPRHCDASLVPSAEGKPPMHAPNTVNVAMQTPAYIFIGLSEIFASVTGLEYAFTKAPSSMKSFIMSLFLLTSAFGSLLGALLAPQSHDPYLVTMYGGLAFACAVAGGIFWFLFRGLNADEEKLNELERYGDRAVPVNRDN